MSIVNNPYKNIDKAFMAKSFSNNPRPFIYRMLELTENGFYTIKEKEFKANLYVLIALSYGQFFCIDSIDEYDNLKKQFEKE